MEQQTEQQTTTAPLDCEVVSEKEQGREGKGEKVVGEGVSQRGKLLAAVNRVAKVRAQGEGEGDSSRKSICVVGFVLSCFRATFVVVLLPLPLPLPPPPCRHGQQLFWNY